MAHSLSYFTLILLTAGQTTNPILVENAEVSLYKVVELPALQNGALLQLQREDGTSVEEGDIVTKDELIGMLRTDLVDLEKRIAQAEIADVESVYPVPN